MPRFFFLVAEVIAMVPLSSSVSQKDFYPVVLSRFAILSIFSVERRGARRVERVCYRSLGQQDLMFCIITRLARVPVCYDRLLNFTLFAVCSTPQLHVIVRVNSAGFDGRSKHNT